MCLKSVGCGANSADSDQTAAPKEQSDQSTLFGQVYLS